MSGKFEEVHFIDVPGCDVAYLTKKPNGMKSYSWANLEGTQDAFVPQYQDKDYKYTCGDMFMKGSIISHGCTTKAGTSGAPIVEATTGCVVGIHTTGFKGGSGRNEGEPLPLFLFEQDFQQSTRSSGGRQSD